MPEGEVGPVVEYERDAGGLAHPLDESGPGDQTGVVESFVAELDDVDPAVDAASDERLEIGSVGGAEVAPAMGQIPPVAGRRGAHPAFGSLARASAFICCLNWRTLASASGESMSATDRWEPVSP